MNSDDPKDWKGSFDNKNIKEKSKYIKYESTSKLSDDIIYEQLEMKSIHLARDILDDVEPHLKTIEKPITKNVVQTPKRVNIFAVHPVVRIVGITVGKLVILVFLHKFLSL